MWCGADRIHAARITTQGTVVMFLLLRTLFLGSIENPEPRYTLECYPVIILAAAASFRKRP